MDLRLIERIERGQTSITLADAGKLVDMIRDRDLIHIDSPFITALSDIAESGACTFNGCAIGKVGVGNWRVMHRDQYRDADSPLFALIEALNPPPFHQWSPLAEAPK